MSSPGSSASDDEVHSHRSYLSLITTQTPGTMQDLDLLVKVVYGDGSIRHIPTADNFRHHTLVRKEASKGTSLEKEVVEKCAQYVSAAIRDGMFRVNGGADCIIHLVQHFGHECPWMSGGAGFLYYCNSTRSYRGSITGEVGTILGVVEQVHLLGPYSSMYSSREIITLRSGFYYWVGGNDPSSTQLAEEKASSTTDEGEDGGSEGSVDAGWEQGLIPIMRLANMPGLPPSWIGVDVPTNSWLYVKGSNVVHVSPKQPCRSACIIDVTGRGFGNCCKCCSCVPSDIQILLVGATCHSVEERYLVGWIPDPYWPIVFRKDMKNLARVCKLVSRLYPNLSGEALWRFVESTESNIARAVLSYSMGLFPCGQITPIGSKWPVREELSVWRRNLSLDAFSELLPRHNGEVVTQWGIRLNTVCGQDGPRFSWPEVVDPVEYSRTVDELGQIYPEDVRRVSAPLGP